MHVSEIIVIVLASEIRSDSVSFKGFWQNVFVCLSVCPDVLPLP